ncbi:CDP-alcohol phosphatidyltransferase family protein [Streptomyces sp. 4N509B]|uniref:CDP-alcohol phosphatidyltransferase family protein n=1 Tax=Streptomyces sp. 4N509B TaxID=3457413 RepID=UPI003FD19FC4
MSRTSGLYALKPWYSQRLTGVRAWLAERDVAPGAVSAAGVAAGAGAGLALAGPAPGVAAGLLVAALLAARLACANLDGALARQTGLASRRGALVNEVSDRAAELAAFAGCLALADAWLVAVTALAATLPSWVALAGAAAGAGRVQGGPVGKTERCLALVVVAFTGWATPVLAVVAAGSVVTAVVRFARLWGPLGRLGGLR